MRLLILGGTRFLGRLVTRRLLDEGAQVTVLHRGVSGEPVEGARAVVGDRSSPDGLSKVKHERFDAVLDLSGYFSDWTAASARALAGRVAHYVFVSSGVVYSQDPQLPWTESTPLGPLPHWGRYAQEKLASERYLWDVHRRGDFMVTCVRFPFVLGPGNFVEREAFVFSRLETGRPILLPGADAVNQFVDVEDAAEMLVATLLRADVAGGQAYNCAYRRAITNRGWVELCADVLALEPHLVPIDDVELAVRPSVIDLTNLVFPFPSEHFMLDATKATSQLGVAIRTDNRTMIERFADWWGALPTKPAPGRYAREDEALAKLGLAETVRA